jgi:hypothetical protein
MERQRRKEATMAKYEITATRVVNYTTTVVASDPDEAIEIARGMSMDEFDAVGGEFTIDYADEIV